MKEKKLGQIVILIAFAVIICLSRVIWFCTEKYLDSENYENRYMADQPRFTLDSYSTYSADYSDYFNDNLQFRNSLIQLNSSIDYFVFRRSSNKTVIVGKDNWLFYGKSDESEDSISNYLGTDLCSDDELETIAQNCVAQRDYLLEQGKEFVIFIAPNKERIYSEYMPDHYGEPAEIYGVLQIYNYLKENTDLRVVYPYNELMETKEILEENIYQKTDTHWNYIGAYVGASALLSELGIEMPQIYSEEITIMDNGESSGDLAKALNMRNQLKFADRAYSVSGYPLHNAKQVELEDGIVSYNAEDADPRSIYFIRDSFTTHMLPYIGSQFSESCFSDVQTYTYDDLSIRNPDIVVYETIERKAKVRLETFSIQ